MKTFIGGLIIFVLIPQLVCAYYTNDTWQTAKQSKPAWFLVDNAGGFYGATEDGSTFTQTPIANDAHIRLQKFQIDAAFFYISDKGVIYAPDNLTALSMYLTMG